MAKKENDMELIVWCLPLVLAPSAFFLYKDTSRAFHNFIDAASGHNWVAVDGGKYVSDTMHTALSGPVTFSISVLFGTLVGLTISSLYVRQRNVHKSLIGIFEEGRELELYLQEFPEPYNLQCQGLLREMLSKLISNFQFGDMNPRALRKDQELPALTLKVGDLVKEGTCPGLIVGQAYDSLGRLKRYRLDLISDLTTTFAPAHYWNMCILASILLMVFLLETDNAGMQFLVDFQLSICWALLVGTYSLLAAIIFDLTTPFSGMFSSVTVADVDTEELRAYALKLENDPFITAD
eukprot:scaffold8023_cov54-Attheya_sp.AAC.3